ncbi:hypothetical protein [uncultured Rikenella sp.]|uniref:hypothetical protein n=1 Tax=uncultured Rikenella sp. TaxID=368003 RepID=UPI00261FD671|nr:hypothetical protein [uncultured Rikenella sp.]
MCRNLILLLSAGFLWACGGPSWSTVDEPYVQDTAYLQYEAMIRDFLVGKRISSLARIMAPDDVPSDNCVLLIYHGMDCGSCLDAGFASVERLRNKGVPCVTVAIDANVSEAQQRYGYYDYIYTDRGDLLRRELKYVNTPILLLLDDSLRIVDMYKPASGTEVAATRFEQTVRAVRPAAGQ